MPSWLETVRVDLWKCADLNLKRVRSFEKVYQFQMCADLNLKEVRQLQQWLLAWSPAPQSKKRTMNLWSQRWWEIVLNTHPPRSQWSHWWWAMVSTYIQISTQSIDRSRSISTVYSIAPTEFYGRSLMNVEIICKSTTCIFFSTHVPFWMQFFDLVVFLVVSAMYFALHSIDFSVRRWQIEAGSNDQ